MLDFTQIVARHVMDHDLREKLSKSGMDYLGAQIYQGLGKIVDAGAFLGASAFCLAAGVARNRDVPDDGNEVISYDLFQALDQYVANYIRRHVREISDRDSYLDIFERQTGKYSHHIKAYPGDLLDQTWEYDDIEILFIDVAKTLDLNSKILRTFFPRLIPGESIIVQQDFHHMWHPYIHVTMEFLSHYFTVLDERVTSQSRLYRLERPIPPELLEEAAAYEFSAEARGKLLSAAAANTSPTNRPMLELVKAYDHILSGNLDAYEAQNNRLTELYEPHTRDTIWVNQLAKIREIADRHQQARPRR